MTTPIALYLIDEASSGTGPTTLHDGAANPVDLTIVYGASGAWTSIAAGKGLGINDTARCSGAAGADLWVGPVSGGGNGKFYNALNGLKVCTIEMVLSFPLSPNDVPFCFRDGGGNGLIAPYTNGSILEIYGFASSGGSGNLMSQWDPSGVSAGAHVLTVVFDTASSPFIKFYLDGSLQSLTVTATADTTIDFSDAYFALGADLGAFVGGSNYAGTIYYYAVYNSALSGTTAASNATALLANNDANPNSSASPPALAFSRLMVPSALMPSSRLGSG